MAYVRYRTFAVARLVERNAPKSCNSPLLLTFFPSPYYISTCFSVKRLLQLRFDFDSASVRLRRKIEHIHFFVASRGVIANKKAVGGAYHDVILYVTVINVALTPTDQHRVASFDCQRWYSPFTYFQCKKSSGMNSRLH